MGCRAKGARLGLPRLIDFVGEEFLVPAQGDSIHLGTRGQSSQSSALCHSLWGAAVECKMTPVHLKHSQSTGNLQGEVRFLCC